MCCMKRTLLALSVSSLLASQAAAQSVLFDFNSTPYHTPLPIDLTEGQITASFSGTGASYSIQIANIGGTIPEGFTGNCLYPNNSVSRSDLLVGFSQALQDISIMYAPSEFGCNTSATMRITGYMNSAFVATSTTTAPVPGTWPTGVLTLSSPQGFDSVVIHYDAAPACTESGQVFVADNMTVTPLPIPAHLYHTVSPCRVLDSRVTTGPWSGQPLGAQQERTLTIVGAACAIPATAKALSFNVTAIAATAVGHIRVYPAGTPRPGASSLNFAAGQTRANNGIVSLGAAGDLAFFSGQASGSVHVVLDVSGYFE